MTRDIAFEVVYPHPPEKVWRALTESDAIAQWLMQNDFRPEVGHRFQLRDRPRPGWDGIVHCEVLEIDEPKRISWSWRGGPIDTVVTFALEPVPEGTRLRFRQSGFRGFKAWMVRSVLRPGWGKISRRALPAYLDRMDGADQGRRPEA